jgi:methylmalonyl-CoA mutase
MADSKEKLFSEFPPVSTQEWMEKVNVDLKGADFEKKLVWKTNEGFSVRPFYRAEDLEGLKITDSLPGEFPYIRGTKTDNNWFVRQDIEVKDIKEANKKALDILGKGITSLCFSFSGKGLTAEDLDLLLKDIKLDCIEINFRNCYKETASIVNLLCQYVKTNGYDPSTITGSVNFDPFKGIITKGKEIETDLANAIKEVMLASEYLPKLRVFGANPYLFNNAGAYCAQELGYGLAYGNQFIASGTDAGLSAKAIAKKIKFNFGVGSNYFMEIAKFRAARMLWSYIVDAYLADEDCKCSAKMVINAYTSEWNQSVYDAYVNLLRSQTETMSASLAGVDSITVVPFDSSFKTPDDFSERIARNQQLLLKEESNFDKVVDPSAGSYYIENLTASIADQAWKIFLSVEENGGFLNSILNGTIQNDINSTNEKRLAAISSRREVLLGTNQYPNFNEFSLDKIETSDSKCCCCEKDSSIPVLKFKRGSSEFDALRLATEKSGKRPKVFMLTIGSLSMRLARAQFSSNFFGCAGYEVVDNLGFETPEEGVKAARATNADIIVICSSDEEYAELAPKTFEAIGKGNEIFVVAGAPECTEDLKKIGIENFINVRSNVLQTLQDFNKKLGIN